MFKIWLYSSAALWHKLACKTWYDELPQRSCTSVIASFVSNQTLQWTLRCKNTFPSYTLWSTCLLRSMIMFALCFMMGNATSEGHIPKCRAGVGVCLVLGPLLWQCYDLGPLPHIFITSHHLLIPPLAYTSHSHTHKLNTNITISIFHFL
jgi:hypothetical protein